MHLKTLGIAEHNESNWEVALHDEFVPEFWQLPKDARVELAGLMMNLREKGPLLGRPQADTLNGSRYANMKELRYKADGGAWRSPSIRRAKLFCWWLETRQAWDSASFTAT